MKLYQNQKAAMSEFTDWLKKANDGDAVAQFQLTYFFDGNGGVERDVERGLKYCRMAADQGYAPAQWRLGNTYDLGMPPIVAKDYTEAAKWYRMAAEQGNAFGMHALGQLYKDGRGVPQDYALALAWCSLAVLKDYDNMFFLTQDLHELRRIVSPAQTETAQQFFNLFFDRHPEHHQKFSEKLYALIMRSPETR